MFPHSMTASKKKTNKQTVSLRHDGLCCTLHSTAVFKLSQGKKHNIHTRYEPSLMT